MHVVYFCTIQEHQKRHTLISQTRDVPMHVWLHVYNSNKSHCLAWILIRLRGCGHWPFDLCAPENVGRLVTPAKKLEDTIRLAELVIEVLQQNEEHHAEVSVPEYVRASVLLITWLLSNITLMKSYYIIFFIPSVYGIYLTWNQHSIMGTVRLYNVSRDTHIRVATCIVIGHEHQFTTVKLGGAFWIFPTNWLFVPRLVYESDGNSNILQLKRQWIVKILRDIWPYLKEKQHT